MDYKDIADQIIQLKNTDLKLRNQLLQSGQLEKGYNKEMEIVHKKNAQILNEIINKIGYPTIDKVGKEANEAAWLIIQHSIGQPDFMRKCFRLLKDAVIQKVANPRDLAYLTDRIAVFEDRLQSYGTQFDWDKKGEMSPQPFDNLAKVNRLRASIGLNTLEEQIEIMRKRVKSENQLPPINFEERSKEIYQWKKLIGWIK